MIQKRLAQVSKLLQDAAAFFSKKYLETPQLQGKVLFVDFKNPNIYHRFFYLMLKIYQLAGYAIIYPMNFAKFRNLRNGDRYLSFITREKRFLTIKNLPRKKNYITISDEDFSQDYFKNYFEFGNEQSDAFHIPMSFHPLMYHNDIWNQNISPKPHRSNSIFCYGNFDDRAYLDIERTGFNVINRRKLYDFFKEKKEFILIKNVEHLKEIIAEKLEKKFIFAEKYIYPLPMEQVRETVSNFKFFLCCPGVVMPLCHNVIEAMSVGTVPLIQKEYAEVMYPNLEDGVNAIIFEDFEDLEEILTHKIFSIDEKIYLELSKNCLKYYQDFLSPDAVANHINQHLGKATIYLNAEHRSIKYLR